MKEAPRERERSLTPDGAEEYNMEGLRVHREFKKHTAVKPPRLEFYETELNTFSYKFVGEGSSAVDAWSTIRIGFDKSNISRITKKKSPEVIRQKARDLFNGSGLGAIMEWDGDFSTKWDYEESMLDYGGTRKSHNYDHVAIRSADQPDEVAQKIFLFNLIGSLQTTTMQSELDNDKHRELVATLVVALMVDYNERTKNKEESSVMCGFKNMLRIGQTLNKMTFNIKCNQMDYVESCRLIAEYREEKQKRQAERDRRSLADQETNRLVAVQNATVAEEVFLSQKAATSGSLEDYIMDDGRPLSMHLIDCFPSHADEEQDGEGEEQILPNVQSSPPCNAMSQPRYNPFAASNPFPLDSRINPTTEPSIAFAFSGSLEPLKSDGLTEMLRGCLNGMGENGKPRGSGNISGLKISDSWNSFPLGLQGSMGLGSLALPTHSGEGQDSGLQAKAASIDMLQPLQQHQPDHSVMPVSSGMRPGTSSHSPSPIQKKCEEDISSRGMPALYPPRLNAQGKNISNFSHENSSSMLIKLNSPTEREQFDEATQQLETLKVQVSRMAVQTLSVYDVQEAITNPERFAILKQQYQCYRHSIAVAHQMLNAIVEGQRVSSLCDLQTFELIHLTHALNSMNLLVIDSQVEAIDSTSTIAKSHRDEMTDEHAIYVSELSDEIFHLSTLLDMANKSLTASQSQNVALARQSDGFKMELFNSKRDALNTDAVHKRETATMVAALERDAIEIADLRKQIHDMTAMQLTFQSHPRNFQSSPMVTFLGFSHNEEEETDEPAAKRTKLSEADKSS